MANTWYVTPTGAGIQDGTDLANAWALGTGGMPNNGTNGCSMVWGGSGILPGDTIMLKGVFRLNQYMDLRTTHSGTASYASIPIIWDGSLGAEITTVKLASGWTNYATNIWYIIDTDINSASNIVRRLFINRGEGLLSSPDLAKLGLLNTVNTALIATGKDIRHYYFSDFSTNRLYLYSTVDPNTLDVEYVVKNPNNIRDFAARIRGGHDIWFRDITFTGGWSTTISVQGTNISPYTPVSNIKIANCRIEYPLVSGIVLDPGPAPNYNNDTINNVEISSCYIDGHIGESEQWWNQLATTSKPNEQNDMGGDGISITSSGASPQTVTNIKIVGNYIRDLGHSCLNCFSNLNPVDSTPAISNVLISDNILTRKNSVYCRGVGTGAQIAIGGTRRRQVTNLNIIGNLLINLNVRAQIQGEDINFAHNIIYKMEESVTTVANSTNQGISIGAYAYCKNVVIANNTIIGGPLGPDIGIIVISDAANRDIRSCAPLVRNNIVKGCTVDLEVSNNNGAAILIPNLIKNNIFADDAITWFNADKTVAQLNLDVSTPETILFNDNLAIDPDLDSNFIPNSGSPAIGNGTTPLSKYDAYNRALTENTFHIGAIWPKVNTINKVRRK